MRTFYRPNTTIVRKTIGPQKGLAVTATFRVAARALLSQEATNWPARNGFAGRMNNPEGGSTIASSNAAAGGLAEYVGRGRRNRTEHHTRSFEE